MLVNKFPSFPNNSVLAEGTRVKLSGGYLVAAGSTDDELGVLAQSVLATDTMATVIPLDTPAVFHMIASGAIGNGATVYADANGMISATGTLIRGFSMESASGAGSIIRVMGRRASITGTVARANLVEDTNAPYVIPLTAMQAAGTGGLLGATAGTPSGAMGLTVGTFGTHTPLVVGESASGNVKTDSCRFQFPLPIEYVAGEPVTIQVNADLSGALQVGGTLAAAAYTSDGAGGVSSNLVTTSAQNLTTSFVEYSFTVTPTSLTPGMLLDVELTGVATDTGGTSGHLIQIGQVALLLGVKG